LPLPLPLVSGTRLLNPGLSSRKSLATAKQ
jgi:hypothetical protein